MKTFTKKGSLSLSVNAIVVLVLAITMLGLGIAFTKNMFGSLEGKLMEGVSYENIPNPSMNNPVSLENNNINVEAGGNAAFGIKVLNTLNEVAEISADIDSCSQGIQLDNFDLIPISIANVNIGDYAEFGVIVRTKGTVLDQRNEIAGCSVTMTLLGESGIPASYSTSIRLFSK